MVPALSVVSSQKTQKIVSLICQHIKAKDPATFVHSVRVEKYAARLAALVSSDPAFVARVRVASLVHDVGKVGISTLILSKPGQLTPAEFAQIRSHPQIGYEYLRAFPQLSEIAQITLHHHEWYSGMGYPARLFGEKIPLEARILCLTDAYEAMTGKRSYKKPMSTAAALDELALCSGSQFDPSLVTAFISLFERRGDPALIALAGLISGQ